MVKKSPTLASIQKFTIRSSFSGMKGLAIPAKYLWVRRRRRIPSVLARRWHELSVSLTFMSFGASIRESIDVAIALNNDQIVFTKSN
jgi:hypothetical protein